MPFSLLEPQRRLRISQARQEAKERTSVEVHKRWRTASVLHKRLWRECLEKSRSRIKLRLAFGCSARSADRFRSTYNATPFLRGYLTGEVPAYHNMLGALSFFVTGQISSVIHAQDRRIAFLVKEPTSFNQLGELVTDPQSSTPVATTIQLKSDGNLRNVQTSESLDFFDLLQSSPLPSSFSR